jgi:hypothetical protein
MADASQERELSYGEFDAEKKRKQANEALLKETKAGDKTASGGAGAAAAATAPVAPAASAAGGSSSGGSNVTAKSWRVRVLGGALESGFMESAMLALIVVDALVSFLLLLHFDAGAAPPSLIRGLVDSAVYEQAILTAAEVLLTVAMLESATTVVAHGPLVLVTHPGHLLDALYIGLCVWVAMGDHTVGLRLLGLMRLWRLYGIHLRGVAGLEAQLAEAAALLDASTLREQQQQLKIQRLEEDLAQAAETRSHHDQVLGNYRTQIENLREALEIAASHFVESTGMVDQVKVRRKFVVDEAGQYTAQEEIEK